MAPRSLNGINAGLTRLAFFHNSQGTLVSFSNYITYCTWREQLSFEILLAFHLPFLTLNLLAKCTYVNLSKYSYRFLLSHRNSRYILSKLRPAPASLSFMLWGPNYFCEETFFSVLLQLQHMADMHIRVNSVIQSYQRHHNSNPYVPSFHDVPARDAERQRCY